MKHECDFNWNYDADASYWDSEFAHTIEFAIEAINKLKTIDFICDIYRESEYSNSRYHLGNILEAMKEE